MRQQGSPSLGILDRTSGGKKMFINTILMSDSGESKLWDLSLGYIKTWILIY